MQSPAILAAVGLPQRMRRLTFSPAARRHRGRGAAHPDKRRGTSPAMRAAARSARLCRLSARGAMATTTARITSSGAETYPIDCPALSRTSALRSRSMRSFAGGSGPRSGSTHRSLGLVGIEGESFDGRAARRYLHGWRWLRLLRFLRFAVASLLTFGHACSSVSGSIDRMERDTGAQSRWYLRGLPAMRFA